MVDPKVSRGKPTFRFKILCVTPPSHGIERRDDQAKLGRDDRTGRLDQTRVRPACISKPQALGLGLDLPGKNTTFALVRLWPRPKKLSVQVLSSRRSMLTRHSSTAMFPLRFDIAPPLLRSLLPGDVLDKNGTLTNPLLFYDSCDGHGVTPG